MDRRMRNLAPLFPEKIFENLPDLLKRSLLAARTPRECDILLLALITNLSTAMPGVHFLYSQKRTAPHLYALLNHNLLFATSQPKSRQRPGRMKKIMQLREMLRKMPQKFRYSELVKVAQNMKVSESTACRYFRQTLKF